MNSKAICASRAGATRSRHSRAAFPIWAAIASASATPRRSSSPRVCLRRRGVGQSGGEGDHSEDRQLHLCAE